MTQPAATTRGATPAARPAPAIDLRTLFLIFLKSGSAFGGGTGITALLLEEFVRKRRALSRAEFLAIQGLARIVPSGTATALAVAYGYRYQGLPGTLATLVAMILPAFVLTVLLTVAYTLLAGTAAFDLLNRTLVPAALAVVVVSTWRLGEEFFSPSVELLLVVGALLAALFVDVHPSLVLIAGGLVGACAIRPGRARA